MWLNLEPMILSELSQSQRFKYCMISFYEISRIGESFIEIYREGDWITI